VHGWQAPPCVPHACTVGDSTQLPRLSQQPPQLFGPQALEFPSPAPPSSSEPPVAPDPLPADVDEPPVAPPDALPADVIPDPPPLNVTPPAPAEPPSGIAVVAPALDTPASAVLPPFIPLPPLEAPFRVPPAAEPAPASSPGAGPFPLSPASPLGGRCLNGRTVAHAGTTRTPSPTTTQRALSRLIFFRPPPPLSMVPLRFPRVLVSFVDARMTVPIGERNRELRLFLDLMTHAGMTSADVQRRRQHVGAER
jgi:hypothetical protein